MSKYVDLKDSILSCMSELEAFSSANPRLNIPCVSEQYKVAKSILTKTDFSLAVCGKVKNGKSSLINALLGRELLPVCTDVATSQVFKVSNNTTESFHIVYANSNREEISKEKLYQIGSQSYIDAHGECDVSSSIAYIDIQTKVPFLPNGVSIIDTPGIGSTYPHHTQATLDYIKQADAALYVMKPTELETVELDFIEQLLRVTPNILFVTTHIDEVGKDNVDKAIASNIQKLEKYKDKVFGGITVLRMSSKQLLQAAISDNSVIANGYLNVSGYSNIKKHLLALVETTQGLYFSGQAYNEAVKYYYEVKKSLENRINIANSNIDRIAELNEKLTEARQSLQGLGQPHQVEVQKNTVTLLRAMTHSLSQLKDPNGDFIQKYFSEINNLTTLDALNLYSDSLPETLNHELISEWNSLKLKVEEEINSELERYHKKCATLVPTQDNPNTPATTAGPQLVPLSARTRFSHMRNEMMMGTTIVIAGQYLGLMAIPVVGPALALAASATVLLGFFTGQTRAKAQVLEQNQSSLKRYVIDTINNFYKQLNDVSLMDGKYTSYVDGYCENIQEYVISSMNAIFSAASKEVTAIQDTILELQNTGSVTTLTAILGKWNTKGKTLKDIHNLLESFNNTTTED